MTVATADCGRRHAERGCAYLPWRRLVLWRPTVPTIRINDLETYYERHGSGPPIVFVHAALVDHTMWAPQVDALEDDYTTITYDVRGHGLTGGSPLESYSIDLYVADLHALLTALDIDRPVLCGASMGGPIAAAYAARYPETVAGLVLADAFLPDRLDWRDHLTFLSLRSTVLPVRLFGMARIQRAMVWFQERFSPGAGGEYGTIERLQAEMPPIPYEEFAKIVGSLVRPTHVDLQSISAPTLLTYGERTLGMVRRHATVLADAIPTASVVAVPDGGHACTLDNPEFFTRSLRSFLADVLGERY